MMGAAEVLAVVSVLFEEGVTIAGNVHYNLTAMVEHDGGAYGGHYVTTALHFCRDGWHWVLFNDAQTKLAAQFEQFSRLNPPRPVVSSRCAVFPRCVCRVAVWAAPRISCVSACRCTILVYEQSADPVPMPPVNDADDEDVDVQVDAAAAGGVGVEVDSDFPMDSDELEDDDIV